MGLVNDKSIAWGIVKTFIKYDATILITCINRAAFRRIAPLLADFKKVYLIECNILKEYDMETIINYLKYKFQKIDFLVYSIAFSNQKEFKKKFSDVSKKNFLDTMTTSCYGFIAVIRKISVLLKTGSSILALTYYGSTKVVSHYNIMGIAKAALEMSVKYCALDFGSQGVRINAISAGPIKTLSASSIHYFGDIVSSHKKYSPLRKEVSIFDIGNAALYFVSDLASSVTGEVHFVDSGYNILGFFHNDEHK